MKKKSKLDIIIQARIGSSRLKGKVLKNYRKLNLLTILMERLKKCKNVNDIIICTTNLKEDNKIAKFCKKKKIKFFRGKKNDVLSRYYHTAKKFRTDIIIRITSDCPLVDYRIINTMIEFYLKKKIDYYANTYPLPTNYPDGMDVEIFNFKTLKNSFIKAKLPSEREHVTPYMYNSGRFITTRKYRFCVDYQEDFLLLKNIIDSFKNKIYSVSMYQLIKFVKRKKHLINYQKHIKRNEGWTSVLIKDEKFK